MSLEAEYPGAVAGLNAVAAAISALQAGPTIESTPSADSDAADALRSPNPSEQYAQRISDPALIAATSTRFATEHYADAVESGVKALNQLVRDMTGRDEDGDDLMTIAFGDKGVLLRITPLKSKNDKSEQRGHMLLCQGVVGAWRNPRAHKLIDDEPGRALMMLGLLDDLMRTTRSATLVTKQPYHPARSPQEHGSTQARTGTPK